MYPFRLLPVFLSSLLAVEPVGAAIQRFTAGDNGGVYTVQEDGTLSFFRHQPVLVGPTWIQESLVNAGWVFEHLIGNGNGILYAANLQGELFRFADSVAGGVHSMAAATKVSLGNGWAEYQWLLGDGDGVIYVIDRVGDLFLYKHSQAADTVWPVGTARKIGNGWNSFRKVVAGRKGILYGISHAGEFFYYRDLLRNGSSNWEFGGSGLLVGTGWNRFQHVYSTGDGNIYGVDEGGRVFYYHLSVSAAGVADWSGSDPVNPVNPGTPVMPKLYRGVYAWPLSAAPGEQIGFHISLGGPARLRISRLRGTASGTPEQLIKPVTPDVLGTSLQPVLDVPARHGCGWEESFRLTIPDDWESGTYLFQCFRAAEPGAIDSLTTWEAPFVVKPAPSRRGKVACLLNVNTWNAYSAVWGGSHYSNQRSLLSFLRPFSDNSGNINSSERACLTRGEYHLGAGELWVQSWLEANGWRPDLFTDIDFHNGEDLSSYRALVVSTHPEYWSVQMYFRLRDYLNGGGTLIYLGGNGIYERVQLSADNSVMILNEGVDDPVPGTIHAFAALFRTATGPTLNERDLLSVATAACGVTGGGYAIVAGRHPFFQDVTSDPAGRIGTGWDPAIGDFRIGLHTDARGLFMNGQAAGLETDNAAAAGNIPAGCGTEEGTPTGVPLNPLPSNRRVLAFAAAADGGGDAEMCYVPLPRGGFVFSVGSITFGGMLLIEPAMQTLMRNVLQEACQPSPHILSFRRGSVAGSYLLEFHAHPAQNLLLQFTDDLALPWNTQAALIMRPDSNISTELIDSAAPQRFFRIIPGL
jgi:hypothetical protein